MKGLREILKWTFAEPQKILKHWIYRITKSIFKPSRFVKCELVFNFKRQLVAGSCKKVFPKCVYYWYNLLQWIFFLFHLITGRHYFLYKFIVTQRFGTTVMLLRLWSVLKEVRILYRYNQNNITMLLIPKVQNKTSTSYLLLASFTFSVCGCLTFSFTNGIFQT